MKRIILCFFILIVSCSKEQVENIKSGCKPSVIDTNGSISGLSDERYIERYTYENDKLIRLDNYEYEYDGNNVSKIYLGSSSFEEYFYDTGNRVISSKKYKKENEEEGFELISHYNYEYIGNHVNKSKNKLNLEEVIFYQNVETFNIDSLIAFDPNGEIMKIEYFEYDQKSNIYKNICIPKYNFNNWIIKTTKNNILKYEKHKPNSPNYEVIGYSVDITYNEFDYPSLVTTNFSTGGKKVRNISYVNCE